MKKACIAAAAALAPALFCLIFLMMYPGAEPTTAAEKKEPVVICVFPLAVVDETDRDEAEKITARFIRILKDNRQADIRTIKDIAGTVPGARDSSDYSPKVRHILMKELSAELILTGNIKAGNDGRKMMNYSLIRTDSDGLLRGGTIAIEYLDSYIKQHEDKIKESITAYQKSRRPSRKDLVPYHGRRLNVCVMQLAPMHPGDIRISEEVSEDIRRRLSEYPYFNIIGMKEMRRVLPGLRSFGDFGEPQRVRLAGTLQADFIVGGEIGLNQKNHVTGGIIVYSGGTGAQLYAMGLEIWGSYKADESFDPQGTFPKTAEQAMSGLVKRIGTKPPERQETALMKEWEKAARRVKVRPGFQYPKPDQAGILLAVDKGTPMPYYLHCPPGHEKTGWSYPLLIFLHGTSARSDTLSPRVIYQSPASVISRFKDGKPSYDETALRDLNQYLKGSFVLMPQLKLSGDPAWNPGDVNRLVTQIMEKYPVDTRRVYLIGCSRGGAGAWSYANMLYSKIAAVVPICGYADGMSGKAEREWLDGTPTWAFHAFDDDVVPITMGSVVIEAILPGELLPGDRNIWQGYPHQNGDRSRPAAVDFTISAVKGTPGPWERGVVYPKGSLTFTVLRGGKHNIMGRVYGIQDLWKWLYAQSR
jgi:pimeloyl-ACP methyl ester carboxylesterase